MHEAEEQGAVPPVTVEGWYSLHQVFRRRGDVVVTDDTDDTVVGDHGDAGWSAAVALVGSTADVLLMHFRRTLDELLVVERAIRAEPWSRAFERTDAYLGVAEAGLYRLASRAAADARARGGVIGDVAHRADVEAGVAEELASPHVQRRLYPPMPAGMPYVSFYPMSKRREASDNWYTLPVDERSRMMQAHGTTGRGYAGRVTQIITGSIGLSTWEWGVTLFAADPLDIKRLVTDMRFDEASARYAEFGEFYVGRVGSLVDALQGR